MAFEEARKLLLANTGESTNDDKGQLDFLAFRPLLLEKFDLVLGYISLNRDNYVLRKFQRNKEPSLNIEQRSLLVSMAIEDTAWLGMEEEEGEMVSLLQTQWSYLNFIHFSMNGADDVVRYRKWLYASKEQRFITMGRPGETENVLKGIEKFPVNPTYFVLGPELPDISSTDARKAIKSRNEAELERFLHSSVADWCLKNGPW
eukprot:CAMPEP_0178918120 /NCGR_PEP_ID=MMETSP0786-20121207/13646_1 /TAXON_ID=186022 /ORGANISM="Thalassionema frauenfeldii, Strain CCMP 1798" /LENGTH=202 /DNA_ID=CAMNT_0020591787 /DNA_START=189 /DNA_END=794 /DNA_ORIENTATION=-